MIDYFLDCLQEVAAATLAAITPAWLAAGKGMHDLVAVILTALPDMASHRRLPILSSLLSSLPQVSPETLISSGQTVSGHIAAGRLWHHASQHWRHSQGKCLCHLHFATILLVYTAPV